MGVNSGLPDRLWGKYRAEVLENNDPKKRGRIKVKCENLMPGKPELGWAESCFMPGQFFLPRKGDYVWIEFEEGDITQPIWVGIMPTRRYVKEYLFEGFSDRIHYDHLMSIVRTTDHKVHFKNDDLMGNKHIHIIDKSGSYILFNADLGDITVSANDNLTNIAGNAYRSSEALTEDYTDSPVPKQPIPMESGVE